jgi:[ribosomal protein S5]-alanine N-acetyltransferase
MTVPVLRTTRLVLRPPSVMDADDVLAFRGDPEVQRHNDKTLADRNAAVAFLDFLVGECDTGHRRHWVIEVDGTVVGLVGLHAWHAHHRRAELGYDVHRDWWGRSVAFEAASAVIDHGFADLDLERIEAYVIDVNTRSVRLLERLGFRHEGTRRRYSLEDDGLYHDSLVYALLAGERP